MIIILEYFYWHFIDIPRRIIRLFSSLIWFGNYFFSVRYCIRTLFSPWKRTTWGYAKGIDPEKYLETFFSNLISRTLGFIMKVFIVISWAVYEILVIFLGIFFFLFWLIIPLLIVFGIIVAFNVINHV